MNDALVPELVGWIGEFASGVTVKPTTVPPRSGWPMKSPENVMLVPALTLMHGGSYLKPTRPPKSIFTEDCPVMSVAVAGSQPLSMLPPPLDDDAEADDDEDDALDVDPDAELVDPDPEPDAELVDPAPVAVLVEPDDVEPDLLELDPVELDVAPPAPPVLEPSSQPETSAALTVKIASVEKTIRFRDMPTDKQTPRPASRVGPAEPSSAGFERRHVSVDDAERALRRQRASARCRVR